MKPVLTIVILLAAAYVVARPSATVSTFPAATPTTTDAPVEVSTTSETTTVDEAEPVVVWSNNYRTAFHRARAERRLLLVRLGFPGCLPCRQLEQTQTQREVVKLLGDHVLVRANYSDKPWPGSTQSFASYMGSSRYPFEAVIDPVRNRMLWRGSPPVTKAAYVKHIGRFGRSVLITKEIR